MALGDRRLLVYLTYLRRELEHDIRVALLMGMLLNYFENSTQCLPHIHVCTWLVTSYPPQQTIVFPKKLYINNSINPLSRYIQMQQTTHIK